MPADSAYGVVHISVCNLRDEGKFTSGMSTQALLGMPVKVLQYTGWYEIQHRMIIPVGYIEWLLPPCRRKDIMNGTVPKRLWLLPIMDSLMRSRMRNRKPYLT